MILKVPSMRRNGIFTYMKGQNFILNVYNTSPMDSMGKVEMGIRSMIKKGSFDVWGNYRDFG